MLLFGCGIGQKSRINGERTKRKHNTGEQISTPLEMLLFVAAQKVTYH